MAKKILIVDDMYSDIVHELQKIGYQISYKPDIDRPAIIDIVDEYDGIIIRSKTQLDAEILEKAKNLRFIARAGAGMDNIDKSYCLSAGISLINAPEGNRDALGEHAVGLLLCLLNKIHTADREVRNQVWDRDNNRGVEIQGKTIGIIGYGNMGKSFAARLAGFGCRIMAYDKYKSGFGNGPVEEVGLEKIFEETEILSFHVPLTEETRGLYDESFFRKFRRNIFVINTARGQILPLKDLVRLLEEGKILGACLDVLENEKMNSFSDVEAGLFKRLVAFPNVVITPHVGGWSFESYQKINNALINKISNLNF